MSGVVYCPARSVAYRMVGMHDAKVERYAPRFAVVRTRMARNLPSLSSASSAVVTWSRPCASETKDSVRSAVHFTARLSCLAAQVTTTRSEEHTSELQSPCNLVCRLLLEKKKKHSNTILFHFTLIYCKLPSSVL